MPSPKTQSSIKSIIVGLRLVISYSAFIIDIVQLRTAEVGSGTYPPAVISMLVASALQMIIGTLYYVMSGRGPMFVAKNYVISTALFLIWQLVSVAYTTSHRYTGRYCGPTATNRSDCEGVLRGVMGLGYSVVGINLINIFSTMSLVKSYGTWNDQLHDLPPVARPNQDLEKAPAH